MPKVPRYDQPQIAEQNLPNVDRRTRADVSDFGGGRNNPFPQVEKFVGQVYKFKDDADEVAALNAFNKIKAAKTDLLYNPKTGAYTKKGENAFGVIDEYGEQYDKIAQSFEDELQNESQKQRFRSKYSNERLDLTDSLSKHLFNEADSFEDTVVEQNIEANFQEAVLNHTDMEKVRSSMLAQQEEIFKHAQRKGLPSVWVQNKLQATESKTHSGIVKKYLSNNDDITAEQYFNANKEGFTAADLDDVKGDLEEASIRGKSQRASDAIFAKHQDDMSAAVSEAKKIKDPKVRDETVSRIKDNFSMKNLAENEAIENLHRNATNTIDTFGTVDKIPPEQWKRFSLSERSALKNYAKSRNEGTGPSTDWETYYELMVQMPREEFASANLSEPRYRGNLGDTEYKEIVKLQAGIRKGDEKSASAYDGYRTKQQVVNESLGAAGYDTSRGASDKEKERVNKFRRMVDEEVIRRKENGEKINNNDVQQIVDSLMIRGVTAKGKGFLWDTEQRRFELAPGEEFEDIEIPEAEQEQIESSLRKAGIPVTKDKVTELYLKGISRGK